MKRTITLLIILILLGAAIFSVGYVPIRIPAGSVAVLHSKTSGWEVSPIQAGDFAWRWELLIPTNATLHTFPDDPRSLEVRTDALLPSAAVYAPMLEGLPSLAQTMRFRVRYRFSPESFARYAPRGLREDSLDRWYRDRDDEIRTTAVVAAGSAILDLVTSQQLILPVSAVSTRILDQLTHRFPDLEFQAVVIDTLEVPDPQLYRLARDTYRAVQNAREEALLDAARELARGQATADHRASVLQQYGRIFSEYPILLEYLEITARTGRDPLNIETLQQLPAAVP